MRSVRFASFSLMVILSAQASAVCAQSAGAGPADALQAMSGDSILQHIRVLASDSFEGRKPGTRGGELAAKYVERLFKQVGMTPGNLDNTYTQLVPMTGTSFAARATFHAGDRTIEARVPEDIFLGRPGSANMLQVSAAPVVYVGYGVVQPNAARDDYNGLDVKGKVVLMLAGIGPVSPGDSASAAEPAATTRRRAALARGAAAVLFVHDSALVGIAWETMSRSSRGERLRLAQTPSSMPISRALTGWMTHELFLQLLPPDARSWDALKSAALRADFKPMQLNATADLQLGATERNFTSRNIVGLLRAFPNQRDEYIIYSAHYDHLGRDTTLQGDQIYNGAIDNAGGVAELIEIARAYTKLPGTRRSILFIATTGEESGLLGAQYYASHPIYPLERTLAEFNLDWFFPWPETRDYYETGFGSTTLDTLLVKFAKLQGRTVSRDPWPQQGFYFRSDHLPFAQAGVPALFGGMGNDIVGKGRAYGDSVSNKYDKHDYHAVTDSIAADWQTAGALQDAALLVAVGHAVADAMTYPAWTDDPLYAAFKAKREEALSKKK